MHYQYKVNHQIIGLALDLRGYSRTRLRKEIDCKLSFKRLTEICSGYTDPTEIELNEIARVLKVRSNFFYNNMPVFDFSYGFHESSGF